MKQIILNEETINGLNAIELGMYVKCLLKKDDISMSDIRKECEFSRIDYTKAKNKLIEMGYLASIRKQGFVFWKVNEEDGLKQVTITETVHNETVNNETSINEEIKIQFKTFSELLEYNGIPSILIDIMDNGVGDNAKRISLYNEFSDKYILLMNENQMLHFKR